MDIIIAGRRGGKTHQLIARAATTGAIILVANAHMRRVTIDLARRCYTNIDWDHQIIVAKTRRMCNTDKPILVDNAELVLSSLLGRPVACLSLTGYITGEQPTISRKDSPSLR